MKHPPRDALGAQAHRWHRHRPVPPAVRVRPQLFPISLPPPARAAGPRDPFSTRPHVLHQAPIWSGPAARFSFRPVTCFHPAPNPSPSIHSSSCLWMGPRSPPPPPLPLRTEPSINKTPKTFGFPLLTALQLLSPPRRGHRVPACHRSDAVGPGARVPLGARGQHQGPKMGTCGCGVLPMMRHGPGGDVSDGNGVGTTGDSSHLSRPRFSSVFGSPVATSPIATEQ